MSNQEKRSNVSGRLYSSYQAVIESVTHPQNLYLAQVRLLAVWDNIPVQDLPWAEFLLPLGAKPAAGEAIPVETGDHVWVDFPRNGDTRYPRITGSLYHAPDYKSNLPDEVNGIVYTPKRSQGEPEPPAYDRKDYLYDRFNLREMRTHDGGYSITHKPTGTAFDILPDGQCVLHVEGNNFRSSTGNTLEQIEGKLTILIKGDTAIKSLNGDVQVEAVKGNATVKAAGDATLEAGGNAKVKGKTLDIESESDVNIKAAGAFTVEAKKADYKLG